MITSWIELGIGCWLIVSPWVLGSSGNPLMLWSNVILGLGLAVLHVWIIFDRGSEVSAEEKGREQ